MQLKIKGFVTIESLIRNSPNTVASIGEISTYSLTYAEDKGIYSGGNDNGFRLYSFVNQYDDGSITEVSAEFQKQVFDITQWLLDVAAANTDIGISSALVNALDLQFGSQAGEFDAGDLIAYKAGFKFPERLSWVNKSLGADSPDANNQVTIWFSDTAFSDQYDGYKLIVVPPVDVLDVFFESKASALAALAERTIAKTLIKTQEAKNNRPETLLTSLDFDYIATDGTKTTTTWMVLIYGQRGDDADVIRDAIRSHVAAISAHTELEWRNHFPDLYKNSEFYLYPRWHATAIPERALYSGTYSAVVSMNKELTYLKARHAELTETHIVTYAQAFSCNYKSLAVIAVGGANNKGAAYSITSVYPDLISVPFTDLLFDTMAIATREWIAEIEEMLVLAETATVYTNLPRRMKKINRNSILYISQKLGSHDYLVACKPTTPRYA